MVGNSLLSQITMVGSADMATLYTGIAMLVFLGIAYMVIFKKNRDLREKMKGFKGLIPVILLVALTLIPASSMLIFGTSSVILIQMLTILTAGMMGYFMIYVTLYLLDLVMPDVIPD